MKSRIPGNRKGGAIPCRRFWPCRYAPCSAAPGVLYAIAQWGREHPQFAQSLGFSRQRTPCVATLHHVFRRLDVDAFQPVLGRWAQDCLGAGEATIAIDGKALRGIHGGELPGVRLVAAYAGESGLVLGQTGGQG